MLSALKNPSWNWGKPDCVPQAVFSDPHCFINNSFFLYTYINYALLSIKWSIILVHFEDILCLYVYFCFVYFVQNLGFVLLILRLKSGSGRFRGAYYRFGGTYKTLATTLHWHKSELILHCISAPKRKKTCAHIFYNDFFYRMKIKIILDHNAYTAIFFFSSLSIYFPVSAYGRLLSPRTC